MKHITNKIETIIYGYTPGIGPDQFLPILVDGRVTNWNAFVFYKLRTLARHLPVVQ